MESVKLLIIEWVLELLRAISIKLLKAKARIEVNIYAETASTLDMRTAPQVVKNNIIHDEDILSARWSLCSGCEFLTESNRCTKCGCFMKVKHKLASARCPIGKWERHEEATGVITV